MTAAYDPSSDEARSMAAMARRLVAAQASTDSTQVAAIFAGELTDAVRAVLGPRCPHPSCEAAEERLTFLLAALCRITNALATGIDVQNGWDGTTLANTLAALELGDFTI